MRQLRRRRKAAWKGSDAQGASITLVGILTLALVALVCAWVLRAQSAASAPPQAADQTGRAASQAMVPALPRGEKLLLKDGSFQLVREYKVDGDRVRYYSLDTSSWEEMPAALVDWDATRKAAEEESRRDAAAIAKVDAQEKALHAQATLDIDASLEAAPGVFLPAGEGLYAFDGKAVMQLAQSKTEENLSKKHLIGQILVPIPIISTRYTLSIQGTRARLRFVDGQPEFYMRTADGRVPEIDLIRAHIRGNGRQIQNLDQLFGEQHTTRDSISMQRWPIAQGVFRFTLSQSLAPGEYALAEIVQNQENSVYVWDFGIDNGKRAEKAK